MYYYIMDEPMPSGEKRLKVRSYPPSPKGHPVLPSLQANHPIRSDFALVIQSKLLSSISYSALKFRKRNSFKTQTVEAMLSKGFRSTILSFYY
jgi:hypothetical protein